MHHKCLYEASFNSRVIKYQSTQDWVVQGHLTSRGPGILKADFSLTDLWVAHKHILLISEVQPLMIWTQCGSRTYDSKDLMVQLKTFITSDYLLKNNCFDNNKLQNRKKKCEKIISCFRIKQTHNFKIIRTSSDCSEWLLRRPPIWRNCLAI